MNDLKAIAFIINPVSGSNSKRDIPKLIKANLDSTKFSPLLFFTERRKHATEITKELLDKGVNRIVAVGGDGTINEVASSLVHTSGMLGIIPSGSGNGLARHLNIPLDPAKAIALLNQDFSIKMDSGLLNDKSFFCTSGIGFDAYIGKLFAEKITRGFQTYIKTTIKEFVHYKSHHYSLKYNNTELNTDAFLITIGNTAQYGNNAFICPYADVQDGLFDVSIISPFPKIYAFDLGRRLFSGTIDKSRYTTMFTTTELTIRRKNSGPVHVDGEPFEMGEEISIKMVPESLQVLVKPVKR